MEIEIDMEMEMEMKWKIMQNNVDLFIWLTPWLPRYTLLQTTKSGPESKEKLLVISALSFIDGFDTSRTAGTCSGGSKLGGLYLGRFRLLVHQIPYLR
jgi:hypothetical protein